MLIVFKKAGFVFALLSSGIKVWFGFIQTTTNVVKVPHC